LDVSGWSRAGKKLRRIGMLALFGFGWLQWLALIVLIALIIFWVLYRKRQM